MTRIFDALRKAQVGRGPEPQAPAPVPMPVHPTPPLVTGAAPAPAPLPLRGPALRPGLLPFVSETALTGSLQREMATLRVNLTAALGSRPRQTVVFLSPQGGEGATTVATQFVQSLARDSRLRVLLVDAHLARPAHPDDEVASLTAMRDAAVVPNAQVLPLARLAAREGAAPDVVREAIQSAGQGYDWVVIDGSPVLESPEAATLAAQWDGVVIVARAGRTKRPVLARSVDLLRRAGAQVLGTVLNRRRLEIPGFIYRRI
jgi:Mrp family chromosome partitioning ATPase